ncbi:MULTISPECIES: hypothetical protein [Aerococcus]|uniref:hypothetical protein n=1 Tax=Aerococcus TaxID=1375 RepID=UPI000DCC2A76|nr:MULTISPECIES: hypothetical protein [Aerococcus]KAA9219175.1 hypothetical protein F6I39_04915 [Aerococcus loyolae]KAA9264212.1 hypothetical protein F6I19_07960 [Aerococcus loyolae]MCY3084072.1 hypothetical protein [Aerococcus mictus]MDK6231525.1 hypothetical protein [Aerococcus urinae]MDK6257523.1 hypothetical protein [Aerococcus urinae]
MNLANIEVPDRDLVYACTTSEIPEIFRGIGRQQAAKYVQAMYRNPEFSNGVIKPTQRTTVVILSRFVDFLRYMDDQKFK